jgi:CRP-like cAMP-binding protein/uncharacterized protein (DUF2249 family)
MVSEQVLDLRNLPVWERASIVLEQADKLPVNDGFDFLTEVNPRALVNRLEQLRPGQLAFNQRRVSDEHWRITLMRVHADGRESSLRTAFSHNAMLAELSPDGRALLERSGSEEMARKGQCICENDVPRESFGILLEGALGVFAGGTSRERLLLQIYPFDFFGEIEFLDGGFAVGRTVVLSKTARFFRVPYAALRQIVQSDPAFLMSLAVSVAQHNRTLAEALSAQVQQPILSRVAAALLPYAAPERGLHPALPPLNTMTQTHLAASAGTVKEVAARAIAELERLEALRREHGHIAYLDRSKLLEIADRA